MDATKYRVGYFPVDKKYKKWVDFDFMRENFNSSTNMTKGDDR